MPRVNWREFITLDPELHHGEPCIKGTRVPVSVLIGSIADGMSLEEVLREYPQITEEAVRAALAYAAEVLRREILVPLGE